MLVRKMAIVLLARLVVQPLVQISVFALVTSGFLSAHFVFRPYRDKRFARAEAASLLCLLATACLSILTQPGADPTAAGAGAATGVILLVNAATLALLLWTWLRICSPRYAATVKAAAAAARQRLLSLRPKPRPLRPTEKTANAASSGSTVAPPAATAAPVLSSAVAAARRSARVVRASPDIEASNRSDSLDAGSDTRSESAQAAVRAANAIAGATTGAAALRRATFAVLAVRRSSHAPQATVELPA